MSKTYYLKTSSGEVFSTRHPEYHRECEVLPRVEGERLYKKQCVAQLKKILKPGATVYCVLEHVSKSGMRRRISFYVVSKGELRSIDYLVSAVTGRTISDEGGIVCNGCGMDMGFDLVYSLGRALWPKGTPKPHGTRNGEPDSDGGYALKHSWV